ncbi:MAG: DUF2336 domain-containing protein [Hyphomicrobiaceae bacterium]|nr:DUF2336 domain-containing protein [Hyphomicrobiaceae bacterium]
MSRARECLDEISDLFSSDGEDNAAQMLSKITDLYFMTADRQSASDRAAFGDVMARMVSAAEPIDRARFAERISTAELAPVDLLHQLARDEILIARPILQYSSSLREGDLVSITSEVTQDHLVAAAHRKDLTIPVTDILIRRGEERVLRAIMQNVSAELSADSISELRDIAEGDEALQCILRMRKDIGSNPISRLRRLAASDLWQNVTQTLLMSEEECEPQEAPDSLPAVSDPDNGEETASESQNAEIGAQETEEDERPQLRGAALEKHLVEVAKAKEFDESIEILSQIAKLDDAMITHCLFEAHISALMVLCKANRLAPATFTSLLQLRETKIGTPVSDVVGLMRRYEGMTPDTAEKIIRYSQKQGQLDSGRAGDADE